jgi:hypothetical protein
MASYFNCIYVHCYENVKFIHTDLETGSHISNTYKLIDRIKTAFEIIKEEYIIWLEDDVVINGHIDTEFNFDLNGFCPNTINQSSIVALSCKYDLIDSRRNYRFSGHGGSVYKKSALLECFTPLRILNAQSVSPRSLITAHEVGVLNVQRCKNKSVIDDILENWKIYGFPTTLCQDYLFSLLLTIHGKTVGPYVGHGETIEPRPMPSLTVQHQYKRWYGVPMPSELRKLVSDS